MKTGKLLILFALVVLLVGVMSVAMATAPVLEITADSSSKPYDGAPLTDSGFTYTGVLEGDVLTAVVTGTITNFGNVDNVVTSHLVMRDTLDVTAEYTPFTYVNGQLSITKRPVTLTSATDGKVYDGAALTNGMVTVTSGSFADGEGATYNVTGTQLNFGSSSNFFTYTLNGGAVEENYDITQAYGTLTITKRPVTLTSATQSKTYDGTALTNNTVTVTGDGFASGEGATYNVTGTQLNFGSSSNFFTYTLNGGAVEENYDITKTEGTLTVTAKPITVAANAKTKVYGEADPALTYVVTGLMGTDELTGALTRDAGEDVAGSPYTINQGTLGVSDENYDIIYTPADLTITAKPITVTAVAKTKVYGEADPALTYLVTGLEGSDVLTGDLARDAGEDVAGSPYAINQGTLGVSDDNYDIAYTLANLSITAKPIEVTADAKTKVYGDADPALTYQITSVGGLETGDTFTGALSRAAGENVGPYAINQGTLALSANYTLTYVPGVLTITVKPIAVTADAKTKVYGDADPVLTYTTSDSLVGGDTFTGALSRAAGENIGPYAINQGTLALSANYTLTYVSDDLTITAKPITVTAVAKTKVYGEADPALTYTYSPELVGGDAFTGALSRAEGENVGPYAINQGTLSLSANYTFTYVSNDLTITAKPITVTADAKTKVYGETDPALTYVVTGLVGTDELTGALSRVAGEDVAGSPYAINQGTLGDLDYNYSITSYTPADLTITVKPITVTAVAKTKVYGEADPALTYTYSPELVGSDTFTGDLSRAAGENVGPYAINQGTLALSANYTLTYISNDLTITAKPITVTAEVKSKVYGEADPALTYTTSDSLVGGDTFTGALSRAAGENVGPYAINQGTLALSANYTITFVSNDLTITAKPITVTADAKTKVYGEVDPVLTYAVTGLVGTDELTGALSRAAGESVGPYTINQGTLGVGDENYDIAYSPANLSITAKPITVTADAKTKVYGEVDPVLTYAVTGLVGTDELTGALSRVAGEDVAGSPYAINQGTLGDLDYNYNITSYSPADLTITAKPITVAANLQTKVYGDADPALTYVVTGLVGTDELTGAQSRAAGENVGPYAINQGTLGVGDENYDIAYSPANLSITAKPIAVTADAKTKVYGDADPVLTYVVTGLMGTDELTGALERVTGEDIGDYAINQGTLGVSDDNYDIAYTPANLSITAKPITVTAVAKTKVYGEVDPALTYQITSIGGLETGDTFTGTLSRAAGESVGTYPINQGTLALSANYTLTYVSDDLTITAKPIEVTADPQSKVYGEVNPALTYQITSVGGLETGDTFTGTLSRAAGENVGSYSINQGTLALSANYTLTYVSDDLTITAKPIEVTADPQSKVYGEVDPALTYQITSVGGLETGDTFTGALSRAAGENVGPYAINQGTLALSANYTLTYVSDDLTITAKPIEVTADPQTKVYGEADPDPLTYTYFPGLVAGDTFTGELSRAAGEDVGPHAINQGTLALANYTLTYVPGVLTITARPIEVTADPQTKVYGEADPVLTYTYFPGLVAGDTFTGALSRAAGEDVGPHAINQGTLALANYTLTYVPGVLTITAKDITVTAEAKTKVYGGLEPDLTYVVTGLEGSDVLTGALARDAGEDVGDYAITQGTLGASDANYDIAYTSADLTITEKLITVTADPQSKVYGNADPDPLTYMYLPGLVGGDTFSGLLSRDAGEDVGPYDISQGTLALSGNYTLIYVPGVLTITARLIEVTAGPQTKVYGEADPALTYQITSVEGLEAGDAFTGALSRDAGENVGPYAINQGTLALSAKYTLIYVPGVLTIAAKPIEVTADAQTKVYGEADPDPLTYTYLPDLEAGDTFTGALSRAAGENVGPYAINQGTLALSANYTLTYVSDDLTITKRQVTLTSDAQSKTYDGTALTNDTVTVTGDGFATGEGATYNVTGSQLNIGSGSNLFTYTLNGGVVEGNYDITQAYGTLTITAKPVEVAEGLDPAANDTDFDGIPDDVEFQIRGLFPAGVKSSPALEILLAPNRAGTSPLLAAQQLQEALGSLSGAHFLFEMKPREGSSIPEVEGMRIHLTDNGMKHSQDVRSDRLLLVKADAATGRLLGMQDGMLLTFRQDERGRFGLVSAMNLTAMMNENGNPGYVPTKAQKDAHAAPVVLSDSAGTLMLIGNWDAAAGKTIDNLMLYDVLNNKLYEIPESSEATWFDISPRGTKVVFIRGGATYILDFQQKARFVVNTPDAALLFLTADEDLVIDIRGSIATVLANDGTRRQYEFSGLYARTQKVNNYRDMVFVAGPGFAPLGFSFTAAPGLQNNVISLNALQIMLGEQAAQPDMNNLAMFGRETWDGKTFRQEDYQNFFE